MAYFPTLRGVDSPIEVAGLKGQYIFVAAGILVVLFVIAFVLSNTSINVFITILVIGALIFGSLSGLVYVSQQYGTHGVMKLQVRFLLPCFIRNNKTPGNLILNRQKNEKSFKRDRHR